MSNRTNFSNENIVKWINSVYNNLDKNKKIFDQAIENDEGQGNTVSFENLKKIAKKYINYKGFLEIEDIKSQRLDGIGNVAVVFDGRPEILIEMAIKGLCTNNNMIFFPNINMTTTYCLIKIFQESMKEIGYNNNSIEIKDNIEDLYKCQNDYDLAVFIGDKYEYYKFKMKFEKDIIYCSFGYIQVFCDDAYFEDEIEKISEYIFENNYVLINYDDTDIKEVIRKINEIAITDLVVIFTKNSKKAMELIKNIKAHKIYVNTYPFKEYKFEFDERKLLIKKTIVTG